MDEFEKIEQETQGVKSYATSKDKFKDFSKGFGINLLITFILFIIVGFSRVIHSNGSTFFSERILFGILAPIFLIKIEYDVIKKNFKAKKYLAYGFISSGILLLAMLFFYFKWFLFS